jgi:hypothetical protein
VPETSLSRKHLGVSDFAVTKKSLASTTLAWFFTKVVQV